MMSDDLQRAQSAVALLARAGDELERIKAAVRAAAFLKQDADEARRVLREGVERVMARLQTAGE